MTVNTLADYRKVPRCILTQNVSYNMPRFG